MNDWRVVLWSRGPAGLVVDEIIDCDDSIDAGQVARRKIGIRLVHRSRHCAPVAHPQRTAEWEVSENIHWYLPYHDLRGNKGVQIERRRRDENEVV